MASLPEPGKEGKDDRADTESKENPFIKFRRFADAQVGSILQSIIGLPSTFSKSNTNPRWADFEEKAVKKDDLRSHETKLTGPDVKQQIVVQKVAKHQITFDKTTHMEMDPQNMSSIYFPSNETVGRDIPLYSAVSKNLFSHLGGVSSTQWGNSSHTIVPVDGLRSQFLPFEILSGQRTSGTIQEVQCMAYNELNRRSLLRSNYSVLPYLLFSPYSPIRLEEASRNTAIQRNISGNTKIDNFPYSIAFEDLLHTTHGNFLPPYKHYSPFERSSFGSRSGMLPSVKWMGWIHNLYGANLLQQREVKDISSMTVNKKDYQSSPFAVMQQGIVDQVKQEQNVSADPVADAPATEQDMYEQLTSWAASPSAIFGSLASMMQDPERWLNEKVKVLESEKGQKVAKRIMDENLPREFLELADQLEKSGLGHRIPEELQEIIEHFNGNEASRDPKTQEKQLEELRSLMRLIFGPEEPSKPVSRIPKQSLWIPDEPTKTETVERQQLTTDSTEDPDARVVATSTTTEQTTHEDGSTETWVTVWKRFSDGRESTTTTNHNSNPPCDENGNPVKDEPVADSSQDVKGQDKKGWFWN